jgi:hypothetical protein
MMGSMGSPLATRKEEQSEEAKALAAERAELKRMMEELQQEKLKMMNMNSYEVAKKKQSEEEAKMAVKERDELRNALATLRAKNTWLAKTMESTEKEAQEKLAQEKSVMQAELEKMEAHNRHLTKQVLDAQEAAERRLAAEKLEFRNALKAMEAEKIELAQKVLQTELDAKNEADQVARQRDEYKKKVEDMQSEQQQVLSLFQENEEKAKHATKAMAETLAREREELTLRMQKMEDEKHSLANNLVNLESSAKSHAESLERRLAEERAALQESLEKMEQEKNHLLQSVTEAEAAAQKQAAIVAAQLAKEKAELAATLQRMELEKSELSERLQKNEKAVQEHTVNLSSAAEQLAKEKLALQQQMERMQREREELQEQLKREQEKKEKEEKEKELQLAKERDELRLAVERMKAEMDLEKQHQNALFSAAFTDDLVNSEPNSARGLNSKKSLFDVMAEGGDTSPPKRTVSNNKLQSPMSRHIMTIKESANEADDDAPANVKNSTKGPSAKGKTGKQESSKAPAPDLDLPAPHIAASKGDVSQLKKFWEMNEALLYSTDALGRSPLFYSMAYDQHEAASYLIEMVPDTVLQRDKNGDTPLHAAASGGSHRCAQLFIRASLSMGEEVIDPVNNMQMTPAHLAKTAAVMDVLYTNGANFNVRDTSQRSPLFIAAAMNR